MLIKIINFNFIKCDFDFIELNSIFEGNEQQILDILENLNIRLSDSHGYNLALKDLLLNALLAGIDPITDCTAIPDKNQLQLAKPASASSPLLLPGLQLSRVFGLVAEGQQRRRLVDFEISLVGRQGVDV